jgi:hypothetical protein
MAERLNLTVDDGIGAMLERLAGGERQRGRHLSDLIRGVAESSVANTVGIDVMTLQFSVRGLAGQVQANDGRLARVEAQLSALIAKAATNGE